MLLKEELNQTNPSIDINDKLKPKKSNTLKESISSLENNFLSFLDFIIILY